jgi:hypothetical protein
MHILNFITRTEYHSVLNFKCLYNKRAVLKVSGRLNNSDKYEINSI